MEDYQAKMEDYQAKMEDYQAKMQANIEKLHQLKMAKNVSETGQYFAIMAAPFIAKNMNNVMANRFGLGFIAMSGAFSLASLYMGYNT